MVFKKYLSQTKVIIKISLQNKIKYAKCICNTVICISYFSYDNHSYNSNFRRLKVADFDYSAKCSEIAHRAEGLSGVV